MGSLIASKPRKSSLAFAKPKTVRITVRYFAQAREFAGTKEEHLELTGMTRVQEVISKIGEAHPRLREMQQIMRVVVNGRMTDDNILLKDGDQIALVPPMAGG